MDPLDRIRLAASWNGKERGQIICVSCLGLRRPEEPPCRCRIEASERFGRILSVRLIELQLHCTNHAIDRLIQRGKYPRTVPRAKIAGLILQEVREALAVDRISTKRPRFVNQWAKREKRQKGEWCRYVWNEEETRNYVIKRSRDHPKGGLSVVSVDVRPPPTGREIYLAEHAHP